MQKPNESKPKGTHNTRVEAQATLSVRRRKAEARQGRGRCGAPKINSKRYQHLAPGAGYVEGRVTYFATETDRVQLEVIQSVGSTDACTAGAGPKCSTGGGA